MGFWNLENLFAPEGFPDRLEWVEKRIHSDLKGWAEALFNWKISQLAIVIQSMNNGAGLNILGVCEVEDRLVLDVLSEELPARRFEAVHADAERDHRGFDVFVERQRVLTLLQLCRGQKQTDGVVMRLREFDRSFINVNTNIGRVLTNYTRT